MFQWFYLLLLLSTISIYHAFNNLTIRCPNGRQAIHTFDVSTLSFTIHCSTPGRSCANKLGYCNEHYICCPRTLKMSSKSILYDRASNIKFIRIGNDYKDFYRFYEIDLLLTSNRSYDLHSRWLFFDETLRELFEMPKAKFWFSIINCLQNHGIAYAFIPNNATSVTLNVSAMTILTRKTTSLDSIYVCYMATRKEHRRQGLATRLLQQIVERSLIEQKNGIHYITMHVNTMNTVAVELYERCGWRCQTYLPFYLDPEPHHATNHAYLLRFRLNNLRNLTGLCRDRNAVHIESSDDEQSIRNCNRTPAHL
ncbi:hypothetical protein I4U23_021202 [Adineta vaga]|nr:hypothetical protein I4U23_021202 [Adineta vaga]